MTRFSNRLTSGASRLAGMVRRFLVTGSERVNRLSVEGYDGEDDDIEVFPSVGFMARPPAGKDHEVISVSVEGRDHPVAVASRDAGTAENVASVVGLSEDATIVYNSDVVLKMADSIAEIRALSGTAQPLAYLQSMNARIAAIENQLVALTVQLTAHTHLSNAPTLPSSPAAASTPPIVFAYTPTSPAQGTTVLKAE